MGDSSDLEREMLEPEMTQSPEGLIDNAEKDEDDIPEQIEEISIENLMEDL